MAAKARVLAEEAAVVPGSPWRRSRQAWVNRCVLMLVCFSLVQVIMAVKFVPKFEGSFADMLGGAQLPALTMIVLRGQWTAVAVGVIFSVVGCILRRQPKAAGLILAGAALLFVWVLVICVGLFLPLIEVIHQMQGPGPAAS